MNSNDLERPQLTSKETRNERVVDSTNEIFRSKNKSIPKGEASQDENIEIDEEFSKEINIEGVD